MSVTDLNTYRARKRARPDPAALPAAQTRAQAAAERGADLPAGTRFRLVVEIGADGRPSIDWAVRNEGGPYAPRTLDDALAAVMAAQAEVGAAAFAQGLRARIVAVLEAVCGDHGVTLEQLKGRARGPALFAARRAAVNRLLAIPGREGRPALTLVGIGRILGGRDHSTISNYVNRPLAGDLAADAARSAGGAR